MINRNTIYAENVKTATNEKKNFRAICEVNKKNFPENGYTLYYPRLNRGTAILATPEECNAYMVCFGDGHYLKMYYSYYRLFKQLNIAGKSFEIFDWGAGQALASCVLMDYCKDKNIRNKIDRITLIEPSFDNMERAKIHLQNLVENNKPILSFINKKCEEVQKGEICATSNSIKLHLFSNILDMDINSKYVSQIIKEKCQGDNYFVCVSPYGFCKLQEFADNFSQKEIISQDTTPFLADIFRASSRRVEKRNVYRNELIFKTCL